MKDSDSPCINATPSDSLIAAWKQDGLQPLSWRQVDRQLQLVFCPGPEAAPSFMAQRIKGRWQHALKTESAFPGFHKNFFLRTLGCNQREEVEGYIRNQAVRGDFADPLCRKRYHELRYTSGNQMDPLSGLRTNYDLFFHVVLVTAGRVRMRSDAEPSRLVEGLPAGLEARFAEKLTVFEMSVMPDHLHLLVRSRPGLTAQNVLDGLKEATGAVLRRTAFWQPGGYVGSVGPYRLQTVMKRNQRLS